MPTDVVIPKLGESISEAVIATWRKADGDWVDRDEDLVELETDKVTMPLPSPVAGIVKHSAAQGDTVAVGAVIARIDESATRPAGAGAKAAAPAKAAASAEAKAPPAAATAVAERSGKDSAPPASSAPAHDAQTPATTPHTGEARATPLAHKIAEENHLDISTLRGTGPGGRVREQDVLAAMQSRTNGKAGAPAAAGASSAPAAAFSRTTRREKMSPLRQRIAVRLVEAQHTAAMLTTFNECDMTAVMELRARQKDAFEKAHGVKLGFMSFFVKAACVALAKYPNVNASIVQGEKSPEVEHHDYCDIAVAVGTDKGLVVPVLRNAESLSFAGVESGIGELAKKARDGHLTLEDMSGGTFTISNGGVYGSMMSTPILNPPQSGILGMHNIIRRPIENPAKPGSGEVVVRPMMYLALSYDHRIVDGEGAVRFLRTVRDCIEQPERMLLAV